MIEGSIVVHSDMVTKRKHGQLMKRLNYGVMDNHSRNRLQKHFENVPETHPGSGGYRYRRRSAKWNKAKQRQYGHKRPNVATGRTRAAVLSRVRITATQHKSTMITRGSVESPLRQFQRREIEAVSPKERRQDAKWQQREYAKLAKTPQYRRKRRSRS